MAIYYEGRQQFNNTFITTKQIMNTASEHLKENLAYRHAKNENNNKTTAPQNSAEDKFMQHFETINKVVYSHPPKSLLDNYQEKFQQTFVDYSSKSSPIEAILASNEDIVHLGAESEPIVQTPLIPNLKQSSYDQIKVIREMFEGRSMAENLGNYSGNLLVEQYSEILMKIGRRDKAMENKLLAKSKVIVKEPTYNELHWKEIQTEPKDFESLSRQNSNHFERTKRKDLILMELLRQKRRRGGESDYFAVMEMKLMEFLDFILQDERQYLSLEPEAKIKAVLNNLEGFRGKTVQGESKIQLLSIFFEEFTALKHEKDEFDALQTPVKRQHQSKQKQRTRSTKHQETSSKATPYRKQTATRTSKKETQINWIDSAKNDKKKAPQVRRELRDQWIGNY